MKPSVLTDTVSINSAAALWSSLSTDLEVRDNDLEQRIRAVFSCPPRRRLTAWLKERSISAQHLLEELLDIAAPYVRMWTDILSMFEAAGAQSTQRNLQMSFEFSARPSLKIDLSSFRKQVLSASALYRLRGLEKWGANPYSQLLNILSGRNPAKTERTVLDRTPVNESSVDRWLDMYQKERKYPAGRAPRPRSTHERVDAHLRTITLVIDTLVRECRLYDVRRFGLDPQFDVARPTLGYISPQTLKYVDSDDMAAEILRASWKWSEAIRSSCADPTLDIIGRVAELDAFFTDHPVTEVVHERAIADVLSLPQWRYRHELYAVWIASKAISVAGQNGARFNIVNGCLPFSFKAQQLAQLPMYSPPLHVWLEVRSPARRRKPLGKGRKKSVQPDLQLFRGARTDGAETMCVVEAKQYLQSSSSFSAVLRDYSFAHPGADVLLVNYGPTAPSVYRTVSSAGRRVLPIGNCLPGHDGEASLREELERSIARYYGDVDRDHMVNRKQPLSPAKPLAVTLYIPKRCQLDVDLHIFAIGGDAPSHHIYYRNQQLPGGHIQLSEDIRRGEGEERATISMSPDFEYHVYVHIYDDPAEASMSELGVHVVCTQGGTGIIQTTWPPGGAGAWWRVMSIVGRTGLRNEINTISGAAPPFCL
jgi:hypothetical protein